MDKRIQIFDPQGEPEIYYLMKRIVAQHHPHLSCANILLGYHHGYAPKPGKSKKAKKNPYAPKKKMKLASCKLASDLEKSLAVEGVDFVILINPQYWLSCTPQQREALLDHELCHAGEKKDRNGDHTGWRIIPHDLEEFAAVVRRHGLWESDVQAFADACAGKPLPVPPDLFADPANKPDTEMQIFNSETGEWVTVDRSKIERAESTATGEAAGSGI